MYVINIIAMGLMKQYKELYLMMMMMMQIYNRMNASGYENRNNGMSNNSRASLRDDTTLEFK